MEETEPIKINSLPTQELLQVDDIKNNALILKSGGLRAVLLCSGLNFELNSEDEQNSALAGYQNFLNALSFPIQTIIHSRKVNIEEYINELGGLKQKEKNKLLGSLIEDYQKFIQLLVSQNAIMEKRFFVVVPYDPFIVPRAGKVAFEKIRGFFKKKKTADEIPIESAPADDRRTSLPAIDEAALIQLNQRADQVVSGLSHIGVRAIPLNNEELTELLYNFYNPETIERHVASENI